LLWGEKTVTTEKGAIGKSSYKYRSEESPEVCGGETWSIESWKVETGNAETRDVEIGNGQTGNVESGK
jgi:hypothetical protein